MELEISVEENPNKDEVRRILSATSYCGLYNVRNVLGNFLTVWKSKCPDLWKKDLGISVNLLGFERGPLEILHEDEQHELDKKVVELRHQLLQESECL